MADTERSLLYVGIAFISALFIMKSFRVLRPASAANMSSSLSGHTLNLGCRSCSGSHNKVR